MVPRSESVLTLFCKYQSLQVSEVLKIRKLSRERLYNIILNNLETWKLVSILINVYFPKFIKDIHEFSVQYGLSKGLILICCIKDCGTAESDCFNCSTVQSLDFYNLCLFKKPLKNADFLFRSTWLYWPTRVSIY